jgi:hypothetical protein
MGVTSLQDQCRGIGAADVAIEQIVPDFINQFSQVFDINRSSVVPLASVDAELDRLLESAAQ